MLNKYNIEIEAKDGSKKTFRVKALVPSNGMCAAIHDATQEGINVVGAKVLPERDSTMDVILEGNAEANSLEESHVRDWEQDQRK